MRLVARFKWWIAVAALLGAATVASGISLMAASAYLIAAAALHPSVAELGVAIVGVRFFGIARGVFRYLERYVSHSVSLRLLVEWRVWFYRALEPLAPARLYQYRGGDLLARAVADVETLRDFYVRVIAPPAVALVVGLGMTAWLAAFSPLLALVLLAGWLAGGVVLPWVTLSVSARPAAEGVRGRAALYSQLVAGIQGMAELIAFGSAARFEQQIDASDYALGRAQSRLARTRALSNALGGLIGNVAMLAVLVVGITLVSSRQWSGVYLAALALATAASFEAVLPLGDAALSLNQAREAARRLGAIVEAKPAVADSVAASSLPARSDLFVRDLSFAYPNSDGDAISSVSFSIEPGRRIAIVGPSGAGKSTLVSLLLRFFDYERGEILLGGRSLKELRQTDVRSRIGVISQRSYIFNTTLRENLLLANPAAGREEMMAAAARAQLSDFVESLPRGYETLVGERGVQLSGGERQRLAIARALLRPTPILILDEPTANLDPATERDLLASLFDLLGDRALILITHRLVRLDAMNEILVLDRGQIVERGQEAELLAREGLYSRMWKLQRRALQSQKW